MTWGVCYADVQPAKCLGIQDIQCITQLHLDDKVPTYTGAKLLQNISPKTKTVV